MSKETTHTRDPQYERILVQLNKGRKKKAPKIKLSYEKYLQLIQLLQNMITLEDACSQIEIDQRTIETYMKSCPELTQVIARAQMYAKNLGKMQVVNLLSGKPARKVKKMDRAGNVVEVDLPAIDPPYQFVQWFMEHVDSDFMPKPIDVNLNASEIMQKMLNRYARANTPDTE